MKEAMDAPRIHHQLLPDEAVIANKPPEVSIQHFTMAA